MEIRIKTEEEFRDAHVTIEIRATPEEAWRLRDRIYTTDEVGHYQATEAELVDGPLQREIRGLKEKLEAAQAGRLVNRQWAERVEAKADKLQQDLKAAEAHAENQAHATVDRLMELEAQLSNERAARESNRQWALRAKQRTADSREYVDRLRLRMKEERAHAAKIEQDLKVAVDSLAAREEQVRLLRETMGQIWIAVHGQQLALALIPANDPCDRAAELLQAVIKVREATLAYGPSEPAPDTDHCA